MADEGGGGERILTAFVEFTHKGEQSIFDTAAKIKRTLENEDFQKAATIVFRADTTKVDQALEALGAKWQAQQAKWQAPWSAPAGASTAPGAPNEERVAKLWQQIVQSRDTLIRRERETADEIKQKGRTQADPMEMFASGTILRRVIATALSEAFGESKVAQAAAGIGGILAGSAVMRAGWAIGSQLLNLPGAIGEQIDLARYAKGLGNRSETPAGGAAWNATAGVSRHFWSAGRIGDKNESGDALLLDLLQRSQMRPGKGSDTERAAYAERIANQALMLSLGPNAMVKEPKAMVEALTDLKFGQNTTEAKAWLAQQPWLLDKLTSRYAKRPEYQGMPVEMVRSRVLDASQRPDFAKQWNPIVAEEISNAVQTMFDDPRVSGELKNQLKEYRVSSVWGTRGFEFWRDAGEVQGPDKWYLEARRNLMRNIEGAGGKTPALQLSERATERLAEQKGLSPQRRAELDRYARGEAGEYTALPGLENVPGMPTHAIEPPQAYSFTSLSGLAEQMQIMASQQIDIPNQQLAMQERIATATETMAATSTSPHAPKGVLSQ